jgi:alkane 1-monooxygenase
MATVFFAQYSGYGFYVAALYIFVMDPILDLIVGTTSLRESQKETPPSKLYDISIWLWAPAQMLYILWALWTIRIGNLNGFELFGLTASVGVVTGGFGINIAHELIHRKNAWERGLGVALLNMVTYGHFRLEHVYGHHKRVATPVDPASAHYGENLYSFWFRCLKGSFLSALDIERTQLKNKKIPFFSLKNRMLQYSAVELSLYVVSYAIAGWLGVFFFGLQSFLAVLLLETINYIEHYGLQRREIAPGKYEPFAHKHAWDQPFTKTNWLLINLGYHALHHKSPNIKYEDLHLCEESPKQPWSYSTLILMSLVPPLWFKKVNPIVPKETLILPTKKVA